MTEGFVIPALVGGNSKLLAGLGSAWLANFICILRKYLHLFIQAGSQIVLNKVFCSL